MGRRPIGFWGYVVACLSASAEGAVEVANFVSAFVLSSKLRSARLDYMSSRKKVPSKFPHSPPTSQSSTPI